MRNQIKNQQTADEAADWAILIDSGLLAQEDRRKLVAWLKESPLHVEEFMLAASLLSGLEVVDPNRERSIDDLLEDLSSDVISLPNQARSGSYNDNQLDTGSQKTNWKRGTFGGLVAAIMLAAIVSFWPSSPGSVDGPAPHGDVYATKVGEQRSIVLEDGSLVHVNTQSKITVDLDKSHRTINLLQGEAMFEVAHDPSRPFRVIAGDTVAEAIGTKFNVRKTATGVNVVVVEGKVAIESEKVVRTEQIVKSGSAESELNDGRLLLTAGDQLNVSPLVVPQIETGTNVAAATSWRARQLTFQSDSLRAIANEFNRYNRVQIKVIDPGLAATEFSGIFDADDPESLVEFLEFSGRVEIDRSQPDQIVLGNSNDE